MLILPLTKQITDGSPIGYCGVNLLIVEGETIQEIDAYYNSVAFAEIAIQE